MSQELRRKIYAASLSNNRSMTQEIIARVEESFLHGATEGTDPDDGELVNVLNEIEHLKAKVIRLRSQSKPQSTPPERKQKSARRRSHLD